MAVNVIRILRTVNFRDYTHLTCYWRRRACIYYIVLPKYPVFIMAMPPNMILAVYHTMHIVLYDFNKLTFLYIHVHISLLLL